MLQIWSPAGKILNPFLAYFAAACSATIMLAPALWFPP